MNLEMFFSNSCITHFLNIINSAVEPHTTEFAKNETTNTFAERRLTMFQILAVQRLRVSRFIKTCLQQRMRDCTLQLHYFLFVLYVLLIANKFALLSFIIFTQYVEANNDIFIDIQYLAVGGCCCCCSGCGCGWCCCCGSGCCWCCCCGWG